jgi:hypothetical protein
MNRISISKVSALVCLLAVAACSDDGSTTATPSTATLDPQGVSPAAIALGAGGALRFVNGDQRPHEIYSSDCSEISTIFLEPGEELSVQVGVGPKTCHFQDILAPAASSYWGTVEVAAPAPMGDPSDRA